MINKSKDAAVKRGFACVEGDGVQSLTDITLPLFLFLLTFQFPLWSHQSTPPRGGRATERWQSPTLTPSSGPTVTAAWTCQTGWQCPTPRGLTLSQCRCVCVCVTDEVKSLNSSWHPKQQLAKQSHPQNPQRSCLTSEKTLKLLPSE